MHPSTEVRPMTLAQLYQALRDLEARYAARAPNLPESIPEPTRKRWLMLDAAYVEAAKSAAAMRRL